MAKQAKRGRLVPLAEYRAPTDASNAWPGSAISPAETPIADGPDSPVTPFSHALRDHADLDGANLARANLCGTTLRFAVLSAADLEAADLSHADLRLALFNQANLRAANLNGSVLDHASFTGANLANAKLRGASLRFATLEATECASADLSSADLSHARLAGANFRAANLSGARLDYADFSDADLADADLSGAHLRYAKNLTRAQLGEGRVSETTILPFYFGDSQDRPSGSDRSRSAASRPIWIAAALFASLASLGLFWQSFYSHEAMPLQEMPLQEMPLPDVANAAVAQAVAGAKSVALSATIAAPDLRLASDASLLAAMPAELAMPQPAFGALTLAAAVSDALPSAVASTPPVQTARLAGVAGILAPLSAPDSAPSIKVVPYRLAPSPLRPPMLNEVPPSLLAALAATQTVTTKELTVEELARGPGGVPANPPIGPLPGFEPLTLVVSLREQKIDVYRGTDLVTSSKVSSGKRGYDTRAGVFSILEKRRHHHSNLYSGAPMPWMQRLTWTGTALHGGVVPGYPASHGCVRLPFSFAPKLFQMTTVGANVVVAGERVAPRPIEHAKLFQPVSAPGEVALAAADPDPFAPGILSTAAAAAEGSGPIDSKGETVSGASGDAPLRILVTRRTERDQVISTQHLLSALGYLRPQNFSGRVGQETLAAIKAFQKANGLRETGAFSGELLKKVHQVAGKAEPPSGHLFVRQDFRPVLDMPIAVREPERSLGTHVFTMGLVPGSAKAGWTAISLEGGDSGSVLDRIEIPDDVRQTLSERLTPGSSLIVADTSVNSAILPDGDDFLVLAKATPAIAAIEPRQGVSQETAKAKRAKAAVAKPRLQETRKRAAKRINRSPDLYGGFRLFQRW